MVKIDICYRSAHASPLVPLRACRRRNGPALFIRFGTTSNSAGAGKSNHATHPFCRWFYGGVIGQIMFFAPDFTGWFLLTVYARMAACHGEFEPFRIADFSFEG
jgi:hypothetical protein